MDKRLDLIIAVKKLFIGNGEVTKYESDRATRAVYIEGIRFDKEKQEKVVLEMVGVGKVSHPKGTLSLGNLTLDVLQLYAVPYKGGIEFNLVTDDNKFQAQLIVDGKELSINVRESRLTESAFRRIFKRKPK